MVFLRSYPSALRIISVIYTLDAAAGRIVAIDL